MKPREITSERNPTFRGFLSLTRTRGIKKRGLALLSGPKQVSELIRDFPDRCAGLIVPERSEAPPADLLPGIPYYRLPSHLFGQLDLHGTCMPMALVRAGPIPRWSGESLPAGCTLCVPFQDPANVGAVIRTAAAFGVSQVVILKEAAHPFHPNSLRAAGTSLFRVPLRYGPSLYRLDSATLPVITLSPAGMDAGSHRFPLSFCLVPGLEGPGIPEHLAQGTTLSVPMQGGVESLNAAMATGIILYLWRNSIRRAEG